MNKLFFLAVLCLLAVPTLAGFTCLSTAGRSLHCPLDSGICCKDGDYCCPTSYACNGGKCTKSASALPPSAESSQSMQAVIQSAASVAAPQVESNVGSASLSASIAESSAPLMATNAMPASGSADVPMPTKESSEAEKASIIIMKNVNALYKGPPKNGAIQPLIVKDGESSEESSGSSSF